MPGSNNGTGQPLTLRCAKCKSLRPPPMGTGTGHWRRHEGTNLEATGKLRKLSPSEHGHGGVRMMGFSVQYRCRDCGHVGWTRHVDGARLLKCAGFRVIEEHGLQVWAVKEA